MTADVFESWATQQLLPNIKPNSIVVMDIHITPDYIARFQTPVQKKEI